MKKLIFSLIVLCVSCLNVCTAADGKNWPLYEDYLEKHVINGKSDRNDAETVSRIMFMALCQDQKDLFLNLKEQLVIKTEDGKKKYRYDRASEALMLAYDLLEADRIWNIPELKKDADTILADVSAAYTVQSKILGTLLVQNRNDGRYDRIITIEPDSLPPFVLERLSLEQSAFTKLARDTYHSIVRGSGDGYVADYMMFDYNGSFVTTKSTKGTNLASAFYLWVGITSQADANRRLLLPVYENMTEKTTYDLFSPAVANLYYHVTEGKGTLIFDCALLPLVEGKSKDYLRTRIKNHVFSKEEYTEHLMALFSLGHDEKRFALNKDGTLKQL